MKTKSVLLPSIGAFLALLLFVALPSPTARASQGQCPDVEISVHSPSYHQMHFQVTEGSGCDIYVTFAVDTVPVDPSRSGTTPISPTLKVVSGSTFGIPYGHTGYIKAFGYKAAWTQSVSLSEADQTNPINP